MKWCHSSSDIPKTPHYAIVEQRSVHIPGDERSRTNPGHGYPETTIQVWDYMVCDNREEWEREIRSRETKVFKQSSYVAIAATPAQLTTTVNINVDIK